MSVLRYFNELRPLEIVDDIVSRWRKIVVPIYVKDPKSEHRLISCGSGFVVEKNHMIFLVTVWHVVDAIPPGDTVVANIGGKGVLLNGLGFITSREDELAVAFLGPEWVQQQSLERISSISLEAPPSSWQTLDVFVLLGYPGSKNRLNMATEETDRRLHGYSSPRRIERPRSSTHFRDPIAFHFDKKSAINTDSQRTNVGLFSGNSGGPVLQVRARNDGYRTFKLSVDLAGIFVGWDKQHKELLCVRPSVLQRTIDEVLAKADAMLSTSSGTTIQPLEQ